MEDFIVYNNLLSKNYLNLTYVKINSPTRSRRDLTRLARAIFNLKKSSLFQRADLYNELQLTITKKFTT